MATDYKDQDNPNDYDDEKFMKATTYLQSQLTSAATELWKAGATADDIRDEIDNASTEALIDAGIVSAGEHVGGGRKKKS